jgi:restriction endonuclease Mrr
MNRLKDLERQCRSQPKESIENVVSQWRSMDKELVCEYLHNKYVNNSASRIEIIVYEYLRKQGYKPTNSNDDSCKLS